MGKIGAVLNFGSTATRLRLWRNCAFASAISEGFAKLNNSRADDFSVLNFIAKDLRPISPLIRVFGEHFFEQTNQLR